MPVASPSAAVRLELEVLGQNGAVARSVTLDRGVHTLGRGEENSATLLYASISRQHALLYFENETSPSRTSTARTARSSTTSASPGERRSSRVRRCASATSVCAFGACKTTPSRPSPSVRTSPC